MKRPYPHIRCATAESPIILADVVEGTERTWPLTDLEALRLLDELSRALVVRLSKRIG